MIIIGTGPTVPINTAESYKRRREIVTMLYANAANETSERMVIRLARSWAVDHDLPNQGKNRAKTGQKITPLIG